MNRYIYKLTFFFYDGERYSGEHHEMFFGEQPDKRYLIEFFEAKSNENIESHYRKFFKSVSSLVRSLPEFEKEPLGELLPLIRTSDLGYINISKIPLF